MNQQLNLFDFYDESEIDKKAATLALLERDYKDELSIARAKARRFCYQNKGLMKYGKPNTVTVDDVRAEMNIENSGAARANNYLGCLFRDGRFINTGEFYVSKTKGGHGNKIAIWQLRGCA